MDSEEIAFIGAPVHHAHHAATASIVRVHNGWLPSLRISWTASKIIA